jgi:DNA (cytosine-5)-methyltransferase 1
MEWKFNKYKKGKMKNYTFISTFCGAGGSSLGYKMAGFKELLAIDFNKNAIDTFKLNFKNIPVWLKDIKEITGKQILDFCKIKKGELDLLDGSPPCQGVSTAGKRKVNDFRNDLFKEYKRLIHDLQPKIFIMENVSGMVKGKMKGRFIEIITELKKENYNVKCKLMNAKYYKVPQSRERLIFIGIRKDLNLEPIYPEPFKKLIKVKEAWINLPKQEKQIKKLDLNGFALLEKVKRLKPGQCIQDLPEQKSGFTTIRIQYNKVSPTISKSMEHKSAHNGLIHPKEHRKLTLAELKRLHTYPDNFKFTDWKNGWHRIGNSVPQKMIYYIEKTLKKEIRDKYDIKGRVIQYAYRE